MLRRSNNVVRNIVKHRHHRQQQCYPLVLTRSWSSNVPDTSSLSSSPSTVNNTTSTETSTSSPASNVQFPPTNSSSSSSYTELKIGVTLQRFGVNLTKLSLEGKLDPVMGRDKEVDRVIQILARRTKNNPILIGDHSIYIHYHCHHYHYDQHYHQHYR